MKKILMIVPLFILVGGFAQKQWKIEKQELLFTNPPFAECHASTILEAAPGKMLVAYFAGTRERNKDVCIYLSKSDNGVWSQPILVADGVMNDTLRYPCWNPVLFRASSKKIMLFYKVGPSPSQWWGMVKSSYDNGQTWSTGKRLPDGILGPIKNKALRLKDGTILSPSSTETNGNWKVHVERSTDNGAAWQWIPVDTATDLQVIQPTLITYNDKIQMLCRSKNDVIVQAFSTDKGKTWSMLTKTNLPNPNSGIDAVTLKNGTQVLVYNPTTTGKQWVNGRSKLNVATSNDGIKWTNIAVLENGDKEEYSYPAVIQAGDGSVHITYTYDRKNMKHIIMREN